MVVVLVVCQEIGWEERLGNDLFYVERDVQEGKHPLRGQCATNFRLLANQ